MTERDYEGSAIHYNCCNTGYFCIVPGLPLGLLLKASENREKQLPLAQDPSLDKAHLLTRFTCTLIAFIERECRGARGGAVRMGYWGGDIEGDILRTPLPALMDYGKSNCRVNNETSLTIQCLN